MADVNNQAIYERLDEIVAEAKTLGATDIMITHSEGRGETAKVRLGEVEKIQKKQAMSIALTVFVGKRKASVGLGTLDEKAVTDALERTIAAAKFAPEDPYAGLAEPEKLSNTFAELHSDDTNIPSQETLIQRALETEAEMRKDEGISNSDGASASYGRSIIHKVASNGFHGSYARTSFSTSAIGIATSKSGGMQRNGEGEARVFYDDLSSPQEIGSKAAENTVTRLDAKPMKSGQMPIVFDKDNAAGLLGLFAAAVSGTSVASGTSFLSDKMGQKIFSDNITIVDDPHMNKGLASRPFDAEGIATEKLTLVEDGVLKSWILSLAPARKLGLESTGHAGGTTNLYIENGSESVADLVADIDEGFYVTGLMGHAKDIVTGNYSIGASGFRIKDGKIDKSQPVSEVTIAGNLADMFLEMRPANDLDKTGSSTASPTLRFDGMTLGGS